MSGISHLARTLEDLFDAAETLLGNDVSFLVHADDKQAEAA